MTHLTRVIRLWAPIVLLVLQMDLQTVSGSPQQHFLVRQLEPLFREDLIPGKNRPPPGPHGTTRGLTTFNPHAGEFGSRITPHSHLVLYLGGGRAAPSGVAAAHPRQQLPKRPPPAPAPQFDGNFHAAEVGQGSVSVTDKRGTE